MMMSPGIGSFTVILILEMLGIYADSIQEGAVIADLKESDATGPQCPSKAQFSEPNHEIILQVGC